MTDEGLKEALGVMSDAIAELDHHVANLRAELRQHTHDLQRLEDSLGGQVFDLNRSVERLRHLER